MKPNKNSKKIIYKSLLLSQTLSALLNLNPTLVRIRHLRKYHHFFCQYHIRSHCRLTNDVLCAMSHQDMCDYDSTTSCPL